MPEMSTWAQFSGSLLGRNGALRNMLVTLESYARIRWGILVAHIVATPEALDEARAAELQIKVSLRSVHNLLFLGVAMFTLLVPEFPLTRWVGAFASLVWVLHSAALIDGVRRVAQMQRAHIRRLSREIKIREHEQRRREEAALHDANLGQVWGIADDDDHPSFPPRNRVMHWDEERLT